MDTAGDVSVGGELINAVGMLQECQTGGFFRGGLFNEGRCGPTGNQRIIIPLLLTFPSPTHTPVRTSKTFHWNIPCSVSIRGEKVYGWS